jgi:hypothetical protein
MAEPVRMQLSRARGFRLQVASRALNGLAAVSVARPSRWGNPWRVGLVACGCRSVGECDHNQFNCATAAEAVEVYRTWTTMWRNPRGLLGKLPDLAGLNLACWCEPGAQCHADVLLELANGG